ncbi:MAG: hypothetical protein IPL96_16635 [Holophagaceae bacterium]|nr:hypothetical protein [Holophagaceae bacterium]
MRAEVCRHLTYLGVKLDETSNRRAGERSISAADSRIAVAVVPTHEELMIARETVR